MLEKNKEKVLILDWHCFLVRKLFFYVLKVAPDCVNTVRDLACHMSNPGTIDWKSRKYVVGYLMGKKLHGLIMQKPNCLIPIYYCDAR